MSPLLEVARPITIFDQTYFLTKVMPPTYHHSTWEAEAGDSPATRNVRPDWATQSGAISISICSHKPSIQTYPVLGDINMAHQKQREAVGALKRQL